jgi:hypothetical protein
MISNILIITFAYGFFEHASAYKIIALAASSSAITNGGV